MPYLIVILSLFLANCSSTAKRKTHNSITFISEVTTPTLYPTPALPAYYRWEMKKNLKAFLKAEKTTQLHHLSYWYFQWKNNFEAEYSQWQQQSTKPKDPNTPITAFNLMSEKQTLNRLALQAMQKLNSTTPPSSPLAQLVEKFEPIKEPITASMQQHFLLASLKQMENNPHSPILDNSIAQLANPKNFKIVIPYLQWTDKVASATTYHSFFDYPELTDLHIIITDLALSFSAPNSTSEPQSSKLFITSKKTPCPYKERSFVFTYSPNDIFIKGGTVFDSQRKKRLWTDLRPVDGKPSWFCWQK